MRFLICILLITVLISCNDNNFEWHTIEVTATAYNSLAYQTNDEPNITAWGDTLIPGDKCIAVSRDLIKKGLVHNTPVKIEGFKGVYLVKDKMNKRWKNRIDIYMGTDVKVAKQWGRRNIQITYGVKHKKASN